MALGALDAALSGLRVSQQQLSVLSTNIANVSTEGYTRKILPQSTQAINGLAVSVKSDTIIRKVDASLSRDVWTQVSATSQINTTLDYLQSIQDFHGPPDQEISFAAEIADLRDSFSALSDSPDDTFLLSSAVRQATDTANAINDFADFITTRRNDAQSDLQISIGRVNDLLEQIAELNGQIRFQINTERSPAQLQDFRDQAIKELSEEIEISYFTRGDGVLVVQTPQGQELTAEQSTPIVFSAVPLSATNAYPNLGVSGLFLRGDPETTPGGVDITQDALGGNIGALLNLRDNILPRYTAQIDEIAHKMALRFDAQGLLLFTNNSGTVPSDIPPTLDDTLTPLTDETTSVAYVGFASEMRVNENILNDNSLIRNGTYGASVQSGSNEVIRRVLDNTFGEFDHQEAIGNVSFSPVNISGATITLQDYLGLYSSNQFTGANDLSGYADRAAIVAAANGNLDDPDDVFRIQFSDPDLGLSIDVDVDLSDIPAPGTGSFITDLVNHINGTVIPALSVADQADLATMGATIQTGASGQLEFLSRGDITILSDPGTVTNGMSQAGLKFFGFTEGASSLATDPYFDITVGNDPTIRITIDRNDTEADLLTKLQAVPNLAVDDFTTSADGFLRLRPGTSYTNPQFGGDLKITGGPFETEAGGIAQGLIDDTDGDGVGDTLANIPTATNIVNALFGSIQDSNAAAGVTGQQISPINNVLYQSETLNTSNSFVSFRSTNLGPDASINIELTGSLTLIDFSQKIISKQIEEISIAEIRFKDENAFKDTLEQQLLNESGVNLDEELSMLIVVQTAYTAAARAVSAVEEQFQELLDTIR